MPHLITIIKYACNIVKYILVLLSALFQKSLWLRATIVQVVHFIMVGVRNGFVLYILEKGLTGMVAGLLGQAGSLSYFEREHGEGRARR
jgi:hypothetical protein